MNGKSFIAGLLVGLFTATTVTATAAMTVGYMVNAWHRNDINILIDGYPVELPDDMTVLEYMGRYYTPTRVIAEQLGAEVTWIESRNAIHIKSAEPIREYIEVEKIVEKEAPITYHKAPLRQIISDVTMNILGISRSSDRTYIHLDVENMYGYPIRFDHDNAYIMIDDVKYEPIRNNNVNWGNTIASTDEITEGQLVFEGIPKKAYDMKIVIPVIYDSYNPNIPKEERTFLFEFNITFEN